MRWWVPLSIVVFVGGSWALAAGSSQAATEQFQADHPGVQFYARDTQITRVYGSAFSFGKTAAHSAQAFVDNRSQIFGVLADELIPGNAFNGLHTQPLMYDPETGAYKFTLVYYHQYRDGYAVFQGDLRLLARNEAGNPIVLAVSALHDLGDFNVAPGAVAGIDENRAHEAAAAHHEQVATEELPPLVFFGDAEPVIWAGRPGHNAQPHFAITFVAESDPAAGGKLQKWRYVCDAATGEVLHRETLIHLVDIAGNVQGKATEGAKADICSEEVPVPMPWAKVCVEGGDCVYADGNGDFVIPYAGTFPVTVESHVDGLHFTVDTYAGDEDIIPVTVMSGFPFIAMHNDDNDDDLIRSQINVYVAANQTRDWVLAQNPEYPTIATETGMPTYVNRTDFYCPCNAWSDSGDGSINFCQAGDGCPNTGWQSVLAHEYGHHCIDAGGSGQGQYGEGMADCFSMLTVDSPYLAYGFFGDCDEGLRSADNDYQYPCTGEIHDCGQLLSGCVWSTRNEMIVTEPDDYLDLLSTLAVNSILLHSGTEITPQITIDFLTLDDDDDDISNGTPHYYEIDAGFGAHNMPAPPLSLLSFAFPFGRPDLINPSGGTMIVVEVGALSADPEDGTAEFHYNAGSGWVTEAMTAVEPNVYHAVFPAITCGTGVNYYFSAETTGGQMVVSPSGAPGSTYSTMSGYGFVVTLDDGFETDQGWTIFAGADTGDWERGNPQETVTGFFDPVIAQPENDHSPDGTLCYVTGPLAGGSAGDYDVDGGPSHLYSPILDLSEGDATISYWRWYHISTEWNDELVIAVSNNGGDSWVTVETIDDREEWTYIEWNVSQFVTPTADVQVRFTVDDSPNDSLVEALIDDFKVQSVDCTPVFQIGDLNCDGSVNFFDIDAFVLAITDSDAYFATYPDCDITLADCNGDSQVSFFDIDCFVELVAGG